MNLNNPKNNAAPEVAIQIERDMEMQHQTVCLRDINFSVDHGELIAVQQTSLTHTRTHPDPQP